MLLPSTQGRFFRNGFSLGRRKPFSPRLSALQSTEPSERDRCRILCNVHITGS